MRHRLVPVLIATLALAAGLGALPADAAPARQQPRAVSAQQQSRVDPPAEWDRWDRNRDGRWSLGELGELSEAEIEQARRWIADVLAMLPDDEVRAWADEHLDPFASRYLDIPREGVAERVRELPGDVVDAARDAAGEVGESAADSALGSVARAFGEAASDLSGFLGDELARTGVPQLTADWYQEHYRRMLGWAALLLVPLGLAAVGSAVIRGDTAQVGQTLLQIPVAYLIGIMAVSLVHAAAGLSVAMARSLVPSIEDSSGDIGTRVGGVLTVRPGMGMGLVLLLGIAIAAAALVTLLWLQLTEAALYAVVLFFPLAFAGRVWPATAAWGRRLLTLALALVGARVVIFALWAVAMDGLAEATAGDVPLRSAMALTALLVMTALAPTAALRLIPLVEGSEQAGSPGGVGQRVLSVGYQTVSLGRSAGMLRGGSGSRLPVTGQVAGAAARVPAGITASTRHGPQVGGDNEDGGGRARGRPGRPDGPVDSPTGGRGAGGGRTGGSSGAASGPAGTSSGPSTDRGASGSSTTPRPGPSAGPSAPPWGGSDRRPWSRRRE